MIRNLVSIPLEQGSVFRRIYAFGLAGKLVSIPLEQGSVFRPRRIIRSSDGQSSQSLWNRAVSFDFNSIGEYKMLVSGLNPFGTGQCLSTKAKNGGLYGVY